jgi:hypothetical protein
MKTTKRARRRLVAAVVAAMTVVMPFQTAGAADGPLEVVASGLDNPRGIVIGPQGKVYVAEAGKGGSRCAMLPSPEGETTELCYGSTGAVTEVSGGAQRQVLRRLPSLAERDGSFATGPHDVSLRGSGPLAITMGLGGPSSDELVQQFGHRARLLGTLLEAPPGGPVHVAADLAAFEAARNPDGGAIDTNPYGVLARPGDRSFVADAGGNALVRVGPNGMSPVAVFPSQLVDAPPFLGLPPGAQIPAESVPTSVAQGPDGAFYVGELTGFPFAKGKARVWRVVPGQAPEVFATGFTNIIDVTFGPDGSMYVLELAKNGLLSGDPTGALTRVAPDGSRTEVASEGLVFPGGVAVAGDGTVYVTNFSTFAGQGQVVRMAG